MNVNTVYNTINILTEKGRFKKKSANDNKYISFFNNQNEKISSHSTDYEENKSLIEKGLKLKEKQEQK
jgi:Fe2+ or Zn2+ uptake regulation protein